jgi:CheY-like chemotaxis protein
MASPQTKRRTVLVVDDNEITREGLGVILAREGYEVVLAANGREALSVLRGVAPPDLVLLDMLMPVFDGWAFLGELRRDAPRRSLPVIVMTSTILTLEWALDHGCQGFLRKPFDGEELLAEVRRCLDRG